MYEVLYALVASIATITSGLLPLHPRLSTLGMRYIVAFASGIVIGTALFEMLPEGEVGANWLIVGVGFFSFYLLEMVITIHTCGEEECEPKSIGIGSLIGISADNLVDGVAIAAGYYTNPLLGLFITGAVVVHEVPQGLTTTVVMKNSRYSLSRILLILIISAVLYPAGALISSFIPSIFYTPMIAFVAGEFLYIGAGELLPEAHRKFNIRVIQLVLFGAILIAILELLAGF